MWIIFERLKNHMGWIWKINVKIKGNMNTNFLKIKWMNNQTSDVSTFYCFCLNLLQKMKKKGNNLLFLGSSKRWIQIYIGLVSCQAHYSWAH